MIQRTVYLEKLKNWKDKHVIKVVTGVRRCGKSTLFLLFQDYLKSIGITEEQIISINLESAINDDLLDYKNLFNYVEKRICKDKKNYIFIDEVQQCIDFEKAVDALYLNREVDIYITGSNAYMLSGELATLLSGRYVEIEMLPLSFKEYVSYLGEDDIRAKFSDYIQYGSFPYITELNKNPVIAREYLEGVYNTVLIKDVATRAKINDLTLLESIVKFLCSNIGSPCSIKKITDTLNSSGRKISTNTVDNYIRALTDSYIFYRADRFDIKGKQFLKTLGKYYLVDTGLKNMLISSRETDIGHVLENIVYFELLRRGYRVNIGKLLEKEVDFVATMGESVMYFQISASIINPSTLERELEPLQKIPDQHPKYLLTLDDIVVTNNFDGIIRKNIIDFLLED